MSKLKAPKWQNERRSITTLKAYAHNPRIIKGKPFDDLKKSIETFGMVQPLVINTDGTIIGGHARFYYLQETKAEWVDCYVPDRKLTEKEVKELCVRLNKNVAGEFDFEILANFFEMDDLVDWGFEKQDFGVADVEEEEGGGDLPDGDKDTFKQVTFTLHNSQHELVMDIIETIKQGELIVDTDNQNVNGNALYTLCKLWKNQNEA